MAKGSASKAVMVDFLVKEIEKGKLRGEVLSKFVKKWQISDRSFDRYWKIANTKQHERQEMASKAADAAYIKAKEDAAISAVMSSQERKEYLTKIVNGDVKFKKPFVIRGKIMEYPSEPDASDRLKAIAELNKMEGDYAETILKLKGDKDNPILDLSKATITFR
jgi:hypothetical protein